MNIRGFSVSLALSLGLVTAATPVLAESVLPLQPKNFQPGRIIGDNDLEPIENALDTPLYEFARPVARIELSGGLCTGFLIGPDLVMTNHHCLSACSRMVARFGYERNIATEDQTLLRCTKVEAKDSRLDFAVLRVRHEQGPSVDLIPIFSLDRRPLVEEQPLFLAGHPAGRKKEMDRSDNCKVTALPTKNDDNLTHTCDTESGNSGSPVVDRETGYVVGLHWGYTNLNNATWMDRILTYIEARHPKLYEELSVISE